MRFGAITNSARGGGASEAPPMGDRIKTFYFQNFGPWKLVDPNILIKDGVTYLPFKLHENFISKN